MSDLTLRQRREQLGLTQRALAERTGIAGFRQAQVSAAETRPADHPVAVADVVRAPHKLNAARERRGHLPISSYHVVNLARRSRVAALPRDPGAEPAYHLWLHFRRGHYRHFESHKTWIKWNLIGDPALGFVDKHYRL